MPAALAMPKLLLCTVFFCRNHQLLPGQDKGIRKRRLERFCLDHFPLTARPLLAPPHSSGQVDREHVEEHLTSQMAPSHSRRAFVDAAGRLARETPHGQSEPERVRPVDWRNVLRSDHATFAALTFGGQCSEQWTAPRASVAIHRFG